ncbi:hypothetical protein BGW41_003620 [Actinomortierella wolfii]|nr:hypothetical protein BGW41_003620 [Actinomortierella wolfii]
MVLSLTNAHSAEHIAAFKAIVPLAVGTVSVAYLAAKMANSYYTDKDIPTVALKNGATSHDMEFFADPDGFMERCEKEYGPVFNLHLYNLFLTVVNGPELTRDIFNREELSSSDAIEQLTGLRAFLKGITKSNNDDDSMITHYLVRDLITPNLSTFTPTIVKSLEQHLDELIGHCDNTLIKDPLHVLQRMVACAMACVFMGEEIGTQPAIIDSFIQCTYDFGQAAGGGDRTKKFWHNLTSKTKYKYASPIWKHVKAMVAAATPVILRRRQEEAEQGAAYVRPMDVMQQMLDNFDKYGFVDIEDLCGHLLIMVLASVHTTSDAAANMMYYLAHFSEHIDKLHEEIQEVLSNEARELEAEAEKNGNANGIPKFTKPSDAMTAKALRKMVHLDSFVREIFRYRAEPIGPMHYARKSVVLSNGVRIPKGRTVASNLRSTHRDEDLQGADPKEFRPWRFVGKNKSATKVGPDFLNFGMGKHGCPGRFLAIQEIKTIACMMILRYSKFEVEDKAKTEAALRSRIGVPTITGLYFTSRQ